MMQRFWSWLAVNLARHAGIVTAIGLVFTVVIGFGITRIDFATGQDSYLNADSQVYKDNVAYQDIFGGEAMLTGIAMTNGEQIDSIFTADGIQQLRDVETGLREIDGVKGVISPLTALEFSASLVQSADGNPAQLDRLQGTLGRGGGRGTGRRHREPRGAPGRLR